MEASNNNENSKRLRRESEDLENCSKKSKVAIVSESISSSPLRDGNVSNKSETPKTNRSLRRLALSELSPNTAVNKKFDVSRSWCNNKESGLVSLKTPSPNAPVTPTTNFRLLTSLAASLAYAKDPSSTQVKLPNRRLVLTEETTPPKGNRKIVSKLASLDTNLSSSSSTDVLASSSERGENQSLVSLTDEESQDSGLSEKANYNRKTKALGLLCHRFIEDFVEFPSNKDEKIFHLAKIAEKLSVPKRRIYDITNILNSLGVIEKVKCNFYKWLGKNHLLETLKELRVQALELKQSLKLKEVTEMELNSYLCKNVTRPSQVENNKSSKLVIETNTRKEKSLSEMSKRFLMLFLESPEERICLEIAAKVLYAETNNDPSKLKTRVRRLYDIGNVFQSLGLIKKEFSNDFRGRKPAFVYSGPVCWGGTPKADEISRGQNCESASVIMETPKKCAIRKRALRDRHNSTPYSELFQTEPLCLTSEQSIVAKKAMDKKNSDDNVKKLVNENELNRYGDCFNPVPVIDPFSSVLTEQDIQQVIQISREKFEEILEELGVATGKEINLIKVVSADGQTSNVINLGDSTDNFKPRKTLESFSYNGFEVRNSNTEVSTSIDFDVSDKNDQGRNTLPNIQNYFESNPINVRDEILEPAEKLDTNTNVINLGDSTDNFKPRQTSEVYHDLQMVAEEVEIGSIRSTFEPNYATPFKPAILNQSGIKMPLTPVKKHWIKGSVSHEHDIKTSNLLSAYVLSTTEPKSPIFTTLDPNGFEAWNTLPEVDLSCHGNSMNKNNNKSAVSRCLNMFD